MRQLLQCCILGKLCCTETTVGGMCIRIILHSAHGSCRYARWNSIYYSRICVSLLHSLCKSSRETAGGGLGKYVVDDIACHIGESVFPSLVGEGKHGVVDAQAP